MSSITIKGIGQIVEMGGEPNPSILVELKLSRDVIVELARGEIPVRMYQDMEIEIAFKTNSYAPQTP